MQEFVQRERGLNFCFLFKKGQKTRSPPEYLTYGGKGGGVSVYAPADRPLQGPILRSKAGKFGLILNRSWRDKIKD